MEALKMETGMNRWNDDRLDELNRRIELCATKEEMNLRFDAVDQRLDGMDKRLDRLGDGLDRLGNRFDRLLNVLVAVSWGFAGTVLAAAIGLVAIFLF
jgi:tetrahydromethanopterin S-methyltransferase subunit G